LRSLGPSDGVLGEELLSFSILNILASKIAQRRPGKVESIPDYLPRILSDSQFIARRDYDREAMLGLLKRSSRAATSRSECRMTLLRVLRTFLIAMDPRELI
jgi:hypothetical protein